MASQCQFADCLIPYIDEEPLATIDPSQTGFQPCRHAALAALQRAPRNGISHFGARYEGEDPMRSIKNGARCVAAILLAAAAFASASVQASVVNTHIISDGTWRSSASGSAGWQSLGFDDSGWSHARAPYPTPSPGIPGSSAQAIWHDPDGTSDGNTGVTTAFFRYTFNLILSADSLPILGQALISVDDDYAFYVNGTLALLNDDGGYAHLTQFVDFTSLLQNGENVFAIQAVDGQWGSPADRIAERLLLDATIRSVPEPSTLYLLFAAIAGLAVARRRRT